MRRIVVALVVFAGLTTVSRGEGVADVHRPQPLAAGLIATYRAGERTLVRRTVTPNFVLGAEESIHPQFPPAFTLTYDGVIRVLKEDDYTFPPTPGAEVTVNGQQAERVRLAVGDHPFHVAYTRPAGPAQLQLRWGSSRFPVEPIPPSVLGHVDTPPAAGEADVIERGRLLVQDLNCVACHASASPALQGVPAPDLTKVAVRAKPAWIMKWLENPKHFRPQARMPVVLNDERDRRDVTAYLSTLTGGAAVPSGVIQSAEMTGNGRALFENVGCMNCHDTRGVGLDGMTSKWTATVALSDYLMDPLAAHPGGKMPSSLLNRHEADALAVFLQNAPPQETKAGEYAYRIAPQMPEFDGPFAGGDADRGKGLVQSSGCLSCHTIEGANRTRLEPIAAPAAVKLEAVDPTAGCMADAPTAGSPRYGLAEEDRRAVRQYLASIARQPEVAKAPTFTYQEHLRQFNCVACHAAEGFATQQMLDGVPPLSIAGQKLRPEWINHVLLDKRRVRPWLKLRMPHFGPRVAPVARELVAVSGAGPVEETPEPQPPVAAEGRRLVGAADQGGLSCVTCHSFRNSSVSAPEQSRGPELTLMSSRLRGDYFYRWLRDPPRIVPNTVMPSFFVDKPAHETDAAINAMWGYFSSGKRMQSPAGAEAAEQQKFLLEPKDAPIVQRCFLNLPEDRGADGAALTDTRKSRVKEITRAIAVGLPGKVSYAFDTETCRLTYAWSGGFLDMTGGWNGRGNSHGWCAGKPFYFAPAAAPLYIGGLDRAPQMRFVAYERRDDQVDLVYTVDGVAVRERVTRAPQGTGIVRTFTLDAAGKPVHFVFAEDPAMDIAVSQAEIGSITPPAGFGSGAAARSVEFRGRGKLEFSVTITAREVQP